MGIDLTSPTIVKQQYNANNTVSEFTLDEAIVTNGSMHITFTIDEINVGETIAHDTSLINEKARRFMHQAIVLKSLNKKLK